MPTVRSVKRSHENELLSLPGVVMVGITELDTGEEAIKVGIDGSHYPDIPAHIEGFPVVQEEVGQPEFNAAATPTPGTTNTGRYRPVENGVSACHPDCNICTTAFHMVGDNGTEYIAGNNHCFALFNGNTVGDSVIQPSDWDDGTTADAVADVSDYVPIEDGSTVDMAWAEVDDNVEVTPNLFSVGPIEGPVYEPSAGDTLIKSGRTTGETSGEVVDTDVTVDVTFPGERSVRFEDQIRANMKGTLGDSGAPAVYRDGQGRYRPAAIMFAGSHSGSWLNKASNWVAESGLSIMTARVADPSKLTVQGCSADASEYRGGDPVGVELTVANDNSIAVKYGLDAFIGGVRQEQFEETLDANAQQTLSFSGTAPSQKGTYDIGYEFTFVEDA